MFIKGLLRCFHFPVSIIHFFNNSVNQAPIYIISLIHAYPDCSVSKKHFLISASKAHFFHLGVQ